MTKKTLNKSNLEALGPERLAALVIELVQGSAALQRRARMELSAAQGPKEVAADIRKRFVSLRRSSGFVDARKQRALIKDLNGLLAMIETAIAPHNVEEAFELLWSFLQLAPSVYERTDDSNGSVGYVMAEAVDMVSKLSPKISINPKTLAERILDVVAEADYGEFDGIIPAMAVTLGPEGLEHLKQITEKWAEMPPSEHELTKYQGFGLSSYSPEDSVQRNRQSTRSVILADIADAQGDVDAYMARYSAEQLTFGTIAPDVARRLLDAGRVEEAFDIINGARAAEEGKAFSIFRYDLDEVYEECLAKLGRDDELKTHLWSTFEQILSERSLRKYLKLLPDFDDVEAEEKALGVAESHPHLGAALAFLVGWPSHERAAKVVTNRADELDGNAYDVLSTAADALEARYPLAATLMRRAMIQDSLDGTKAKRYRYAARHLAECQSLEPAIGEHGPFPTHVQFVAAIRKKHGRKHGFWQLVDERQAISRP